jgi:hypothetical protein
MRGEWRDGALLGSGCEKWKAMAAGAQAVSARHVGAASRGGMGGKVERVWTDKGMKMRTQFPGSSMRRRQAQERTAAMSIWT